MKPLLAALALLATGCVLLVDDPDGWAIGASPGNAAGSAGSAGSSAQGAGPGLTCYASENRCSCEPTEPGDDDSGPACGGAAHPGWLCCGDIQYAASNTSCECRALSCKLTARGCDCYLGSSHGPDSTCEPRDDGDICCRSSISCECGPKDEIYCDPANVVPRCEATRLRCDSTRYEYCSPLPR